MPATMQPPRPPGVRPGDVLLRSWIRSVTAGEFAGFCGPALVGALVWDSSPSLALPALVAAGSLEGAILGWSQARVLRRRLPALSTRRWIAGTSVAAAVAWLLGMLPSSTHNTWSHWPAPLVAVVGVLAGLALLGSIGVAQWLELRRHVPRAALWILATAVAWCVGLLAFVGVSTPLWHPGQALSLVAMIGALAGLAMAASMALTTGLAMRHLSTSPLSATGP